LALAAPWIVSTELVLRRRGGAVAIRFSGPVRWRLWRGSTTAWPAGSIALRPSCRRDATVLRAQLRGEAMKVAPRGRSSSVARGGAQDFARAAVRCRGDANRQWRRAASRTTISIKCCTTRSRRRRPKCRWSPYHAGGLAHRAPEQRAPRRNFLNRLRRAAPALYVTPRCGGLASRSPATRVRRWCRRGPAGAAIAAPPRQAGHGGRQPRRAQDFNATSTSAFRRKCSGGAPHPARTAHRPRLLCAIVQLRELTLRVE